MLSEDPTGHTILFTNIQKAINYSMTSFFLLREVYGDKTVDGKFHPRSFNMGFSQEVLKATGGFSGLRFWGRISI